LSISQLQRLPCAKLQNFGQKLGTQGQPTAGDKTIDGDMILVAQAITLGVPDIVIATTNVGHLSRFIAAELWQNVAPS
jgi:hypothetical protein